MRGSIHEPRRRLRNKSGDLNARLNDCAFEIAEVLAAGGPKLDLLEPCGGRRADSIRKRASAISKKPLDARREREFQSLAVTQPVRRT